MEQGKGCCKVMITVKNMNFEYSGTPVLHDIDLHVQKGAVTAMVGPNGAGKTTLLRCISGLEMPVSGTVTVDGFDVIEHPRAVHMRTGYLSDFFGLYNDLTVRQNLIYMAWCHKLNPETLELRVLTVAEQVGLVERLDQRAGELSRGYRQRLGIGMTILHEPKLLLLDEPASGMDPESRIGFSDLILTLREEGYTMVVSSHILAELEDYCTDMLVMRDGRIVEHVYLSEHLSRDKNKLLMIGITGLSEKHIKTLKEDKAISDVKKGGGDIVMCRTAASPEELNRLLKRLLQKKLPVYQFAVQQKSLQKAYMELAETAGLQKKRGG